MKRFFLLIFLEVAKIGIKILYFFIKIFTRTKNKVTMLSRQSNNVNIDFKLLKKELESRNEEFNNVKIKILCRKIPNDIFGRIKYCFYTIKCMYHIATSKVCIIDGYNIAISVLKHKKNLKIIQIWHAMGAIKKFGYQILNKKEGTSEKITKMMNMHANYNCITCTSKATKEIYSKAFNTNIDKIKVLGMPRIDYILGKENEINEKVKELLEENPKLKEKKNILYVPTFRKNEILDILKIINVVDKEKYNLIIRLHPLDKTKVEDEYLINNKYNTFDLIKIADYVITDYSAIAFEVATLNKPIFFYVYDIEKYNKTRGLNINLLEEMKSSSKTNIKDIIDIIENDTYNYNELKKFKQKYIETTDDKNTKRIVDYIIENYY